MKRLQLFVTLLTLVGIVTTIDAATAGCRTIKHYTRRSDSRHKPRQLVGDYQFTHLRDKDSCYGLLSIMPAYSVTFRSEKILNCLFGGCLCEDNCCYGRAIKVQGSAVEDRNSRAWLADYFYLPRNYEGVFAVKPIIKTFTLNFDCFLGLDGFLRGLYLRLYGPLAHSRWDLNFCDRVTTPGTPMDHSCGYFSQAAYPGNSLLQSFCDYMCGAIPEEVEGNDITFNTIKYAKMSKCARSETGFADLRMELGYDIFNCDDYRFGINIQAAAPTGKMKKPCYLFDAMVGNGNHWELGGGLGGHFCLWESDEENRRFNFVYDANITTMFKNRQCRTFDICGKANSAYMLAAKFGDNDERESPPTALNVTDFQVGWAESQSTTPDTAANLDATTPTPNKQFAFEYMPIANLSTLNVDVRINVHADVVAMFNYVCGDFTWDLGYNFWARSCEKICANARCNRGTLYDSAQANTWALKGDARMFGFQLIGTDAVVANADLKAVPLSATQCSATIYAGTNQVDPTKLVENNATTLANTAGYDSNNNVDSPDYAFALSPVDVAGHIGPLALTCDKADPPFASVAINEYATLATAGTAPNYYQIKTSSTPLFLSCKSVDLTGIRGISHALFSNISWHCQKNWGTPYIGLGCSVEFGNGNCDNCCDNSTCGSNCTANSCTSCCSNNCCPCCIDCAVAQWTIWVKGGCAWGNH